MPLFRRIIEDYEAKLEPATLNGCTQRTQGKVERELFGNEEEELSLRFRHLDLPDGTVVEAVVGARVIGSITVTGGRGKLLLRKKDGCDVPVVGVGDVVEVRYLGAPLLVGTFRED